MFIIINLLLVIFSIYFIYNLLNNLDLSLKNKKKVRRSFNNVENKVRKLSNPKISTKYKRNLLKEEQVGGGVFSILSSIILPIIASAIASNT